MNYSYPMSSPYIQAAMNQAIQAFMSGGALPPGCMIMTLPYPQAQQMLPQIMMNAALTIPQQAPYYGASPYAANPQTHAIAPPQNYNYPIVPYNHNNNKTKHSKKKHSHQPHSNIYNSSSFDSYMDGLSWSRIFDRPSRKTSKQTSQDPTSTNYDKKSNSSKKHRSNSTSSSTSTTTDETIQRVNVNNNPIISSNITPKQQTKGSLPFKYSSEFVPGINKQQQPQPQHNSQKIKSNDVFIVKKP